MSDDVVAVTGAGGYLGSRLVAGLGGQARALVRRRVPYIDAARQTEVDLLGSRASLVDALNGASAVVHLAGHNEVIAAEDPERALAETVRITQRVADAARAAGVRRLVYVSTIHVYGRSLAGGEIVDESTLPSPISTYAIARLASEHVVEQLAADIDVVVLRLSNGIGAPVAPEVDRWSLVGPDLCRQAATTGRMVLKSAGLQHRDFVALDDVCAALVAAAAPRRVPAGTYNLASGHPVTIRRLAEHVQAAFEAATGTRPALEVPPSSEAPPAPVVIDASRLAATGVRVMTPLEHAVDELVEFCLAHRAGLATTADLGG